MTIRLMIRQPDWDEQTFVPFDYDIGDEDTETKALELFQQRKPGPLDRRVQKDFSKLFPEGLWVVSGMIMEFDDDGYPLFDHDEDTGERIIPDPVEIHKGYFH
jgi:hypothetical protein